VESFNSTIVSRPTMPSPETIESLRLQAFFFLSIFFSSSPCKSFLLNSSFALTQTPKEQPISYFQFPFPVNLPHFANMSTRRTTRATSKAASSRGVSPAITEISIPATPARRSSRRAGSATPLPSVPNKPSAAYGDNTTVQPAALKVPAAGQEIGSALNNILEPQSNGLPVVNEEETPGTSGSKLV
jgi:hypothetical protein